VATEDIRHFQAGRHDAAGSGGRHDLQPQPVERALGPSDEAVRHPRVARRARQIGMPQEHLNDPDIGAGLQEMSGKAVPQRVHRHVLGQAGRGAGRSAGGVQHLDVDRLGLIATGKEPVLRPGEPPVSAQDTEQLRRQHDVAVLAAFAVLDTDHHPAAVDIADLEPDRLGRARPRGVGGGQRGAGLQARNGFEKADDTVDDAEELAVRQVFDDLNTDDPSKSDPVKPIDPPVQPPIVPNSTSPPPPPLLPQLPDLDDVSMTVADTNGTTIEPRQPGPRGGGSSGVWLPPTPEEVARASRLGERGEARLLDRAVGLSSR